MEAILTMADGEGDASLPAHLLEKLTTAEAVWFGSTRADGRAHLAPIWYVWHKWRAYVVTQPDSVRARNIATHPAVSLALPDPINVLIVEGTAQPAPAQLAELRPRFQAKYAWDIGTDAEYSLILAVTPRKIMAWGEHGDGRWHFDAQGRLQGERGL
jgi:hypothetical protein